MMTKLEKKLNTIDACPEALDWASSQKGSFQESWDKCERADWMSWLLNTTGSDHKKMVLVSCEIARTVLKYVPNNEKRPLEAIQVTEAWVRGEATLDEVRRARRTVSSAASSFAKAATDDDAATDSFYAIYATYVATCYATCDSSSEASAADAASYAADTYSGEARKKSLINSAKIIRNFFPKPPRF